MPPHHCRRRPATYQTFNHQNRKAVFLYRSLPITPEGGNAYQEKCNKRKGVCECKTERLGFLGIFKEIGAATVKAKCKTILYICQGLQKHCSVILGCISVDGQKWFNLVSMASVWWWINTSSRGCGRLPCAHLKIGLPASRSICQRASQPILELTSSVSMLTHHIAPRHEEMQGRVPLAVCKWMSQI